MSPTCAPQAHRPVFISWAPYCSRSDNIAKRLGGVSYMVYSPRWGSHYSTILLKYASQTLKTFRLLFKMKPRVIFVMTPPVVACFPVWLYARAVNGLYVIDAHTAAFMYFPRWRLLLPLHRFFSRRAVTTTVTNRHLQNIVLAWRARADVVPDVPVSFGTPELVTLNGGCHMTLVASFTKDEPLEVFLEAARQLPDIQFHVTGNFDEADPRLISTASANVEFTGFLPESRYAGLLRASDAIICLTTFDHTMQRGAYEAIYLEKPVITSTFEILRSAFNRGTVHVDNTVQDLVRGILKMRDNLQRYRDEARDLRRQKIDHWRRTEVELRRLLTL